VIKRIAPILVLLAFLPLQLHGQQIGASVTGHVLDPAGALISGASIKLVSTTTGAVYPTVSDSAGLYQLPFVHIGEYALSVEMEGFKKYQQAGITLIGDQKAVIDVTLQLGAVTQTINVTANASVLQTESGDRVSTIDNIKLDPEVLRGQNSIVTTWFTPGVEVTSGDQKIRPWDNAGTQAEIFNGGQDGSGANGASFGVTSQAGGNLVMVDGISSNRGGNGTGFNLMASAVDQVIVQSTQYDAQQGWTTGGYVNTLSKGGSNTWHGHAYDYIQNTILNAEDWGQQHGGPGGTNAGRAPWHFNYFGGEIGGPIKKNKIFVFYGYQYMWSIQRDPFTISLPTQAERQGNFQGVCSGADKSGNCIQVQLFDPSTTPQSTTACSSAGASNACRTQTGAFFQAPNVMNPAAINPIAKSMLAVLPQPVLTGTLLPCGTVASGQSGPTAGLCGSFLGNKSNDSQSRKFVDQFPEHTGRIDWNFTDTLHAFFRFSKNDLAETRSYWYSTTASINPLEQSGNNPLFRGNQAYALEVTKTLSPTTVLELRTGMDRYPNGGGDSTITTDPTSWGFSPTWKGLVGKLTPEISFQNVSYGQLAGTLPSYTASDIWNHEAVVSHTRGKHNLKFGWQRFDLADYSESHSVGSYADNGIFYFNGNFTSQNPTGPVGATGNPMADFLVGYPNQLGIAQPTYPEYWMHEESVFAQDDWHLNRRLTLNLGLRWDYEGPIHEKYNRLLNGFAFQSASPLGTMAGYTNSFSVSGTPYSFTFPSQQLLGGPTFAGANSAPSGIFHPKYDNFGPRLSFAYDMGHDMVLRGGWGVIYAQQLLEVGAAPGFSGTTTANTAPLYPGVFDPNLSFANPIQTGLLPIVGSGYGLATNMGAGISFGDPDMDIPRTQQFSLEIQKRLGKDWLFSLAYVGNVAHRLNVNHNLDYVPLADLPYTPNFTTNTLAPGGGGAATNAFLNASVKPNPFSVPAAYAGETKGTFVQAGSVGQAQLLYQYPQFSQVTENWIPIGQSHYNSLQFYVEKRLSYGLEFNANFTWSKTLQATGFFNSQDPFPRQYISNNDMPRRFNMNFVYFLPAGPGQRFFSQSNPVLSRIVSGWSISATPMIEDGLPAPVPNGLMPTGAPQTTPNRNLLHWFNTCYVNLSGVNTDCSIDSTPAWRQTQPNQLIEWGPYMSGVRYVGVHDLQLGIKKETRIKERFQLTYRMDMINALNSAQFFGDLNTTYTNAQLFGMAGHPAFTPSDDPRIIQMSLQLKF